MRWQPGPFIISLILVSLIISPLTPIFPVNTVNAADATQPKIQLSPGDARTSTNKPDIFAFANTQYAASPSEFTIEVNGNFWRYYQWVSLTEKGAYLKATTNIDTTNVGVQLWGDATDGWGKVSVDGAEVWRGNTYGTNGDYPGGCFANYLEISNLPLGKHTIVVEVLGINGQGGQPDVTIFFFGLKRPLTPAKTDIPVIPAPTPVITTPANTQTSMTTASRVDPTTSNGLATLMALKAANGKIAADPSLDADVDGIITEKDAQQILRWSVQYQAGTSTSSQQTILDLFGLPALFNISYIPDDEIDPEYLIRTEIWFYPEHQKKITFVAGEIYSSEDFVPDPGNVVYPQLNPEDFHSYLNYDQVVKRLGNVEVEPADFLSEEFTEIGINTYLSENAFFMLADDQLIYLETFGASGASTSTKAPPSLNNTFALYQIVNNIQFNLFNPTPVYAGEFFLKTFFKKGGKALEKVGNGVVHVVSKVTGAPRKVFHQILPRRVANIASFIAEFHMGRLRILRDIAKLNKISDIKNQLDSLANLDKTLAGKINDQITILQAEQKRINEMGPTQLGLSVWKLQERRNSVKDLITGLQKIADGLSQRSKNPSLDSMLKLAAGKVANKIFNKFQNVVLQQTADQLSKLGGGGIIKDFLAKGGKGLDPTAIIDLYLQNDITRISGRGDLSQELKNRIVSSLKDSLKKNKSNTLKNWRQIVNDTIDQAVQETGAQPTGTQPKPVQYSMSVTTSPTEVKPGGDLTIKVTINPGKSTAIYIDNKGPYNTTNDGTYTQTTKVDTKAAAGTVTILARAPDLGIDASTSYKIVVDKPQSPSPSPSSPGPSVLWQRLDLVGSFTRNISGDWSVNTISITIDPQDNDYGKITGTGRATKRDGTIDIQYTFEGIFQRATMGTPGNARCSITVKSTAQGKTSTYQGTCGWGATLLSNGNLEGEIFPQDFPVMVQPTTFVLKKK
jgi:hypothetical protein